MQNLIMLHAGSIFIGLLLSIFSGAMISVVAFAGCTGARMARIKTFRIFSVVFFLFYMCLHVIMFTWR